MRADRTPYDHGVLIEVTGVLDDGARPADRHLSADSREALTIRQGEDTTVRVTLVNRAGAPVVLGAGEHLVLSVRTVPTPASKRLLVKQSTPAPNKPTHVYDIAIASADTRSLTMTRAIYDVVAVRSGGKREVVKETSHLVIARSVGDMANLP